MFILYSFMLFSVAASQSVGDIRLVGGTTPYEGRVEVLYDIDYVSGVHTYSWGTVCDHSWDSADARVVCRQLDYSTNGATPYMLAYFGHGTGTIYLDRVKCSGSESRLTDCNYDPNTSDCGHHEDAGVSCSPLHSHNISSSYGPYTTSQSSCDDGTDCTHSQDAGVDCLPSLPFSEGEIRLVDGANLWEGRVEIYYQGAWGTIDDDPWTTENAQVVCRQLGYPAQGAFPYSKAHFGRGTGPIHLDEVRCVGSESTLLDCSYETRTGEDRHKEDAGVGCQPVVPPAPQNISVESLSSTSLRVKWAPLASMTAEYGTILQYSVVCSVTNLNEDHRLETVQNNITEVDMTTLQPYTTYNCCVNAENIAGAGVPVCGDGSTLEDVPSSAPVELKATPLDAKSLLLTWSPPLEANRNGVIRMYYVNLTEEETGTTFHFKTELTNWTQTPLHPHYHYSCIVAAFTVGVGPYSSPLTVQMPEDIPSGSPRIMAALRTGPTAMEVAFTPVSMQESNGVITAYLVTYYLNSRNTGCQSPVPTMAPANATVAVIEGLDSSQEYCVTVAARTSVGIGEPSQVVTVGLFSSVIVQVQLLGGPPCTWSLVTQDSAPVLAAVIESLLFAVNSDCISRCSLAANNIRDSRLICCEEQKDEVAFQAIIYDIDSNELENYLQKWVDSRPQIRGWNTLLNVSISWQYGLSDDAFLDSEANCDKVQPSSSFNSNSGNSASDSAVALGVTLPLVLILFVLVTVVTAIVCCKKKCREPVPNEERVPLRQQQHHRDALSQTDQATPPSSCTFKP